MSRKPFLHSPGAPEVFAVPRNHAVRGVPGVHAVPRDRAVSRFFNALIFPIPGAFLTLFLTTLLTGLLVLFLTAFTGLLASASAGEWKGKRVVKDGVVHVMNPAEPMEPPAIYELRELWRLESETEDGELVFGMLRDVKVDKDGNVYILDTHLRTVHVISPTGEYLRSIGRAGEGPGELDHPVRLSFLDDGTLCIADANRGKLVLLTKDGRPAGEWRVKLDGYDRARLDLALASPHGFLANVATRRIGKEATRHSDLIGIFDDEGQLIARAAEREYTRVRGANFIYDEEKMASLRLLGTTVDGYPLVAQSYLDYRIDVFSPDGRKKMVIEREYEPVRRRKELIAESRAYWEGYFSRKRNAKIIVSEYEMSVGKAAGYEDGSIWVGTSRS
ncbi:MAG: hypothetical protein KAY24_08470, partial [Candidatus Eisenbacteria sp.]|nr:hypothetical protein [Candidatus Eisenbacteria bacterium]